MTALVAQRQVLAWHRNGSGAVGEALQARRRSEVFKALCAILRLNAPADVFSAAGSEAVERFWRTEVQAFRTSGLAAPTHGTPPTTAEAAACLNVAAAPLLEAPSTDHLAELLAPLAHSNVAERRQALRRIGVPGPAGEVWSQLLSTRTRFSSASRYHRRQGLEARMVPQLIDEDWYLQQAAALMPHAAATTGRRVCSLGVARLAGASTWGEAAEQLDLPVDASRQLCDVVSRRVTDQESFWHVIGAWADQLLAEAIDYAARRDDLAGLLALEGPEWVDFCRSHGLVNTSALQRNAAAWLWAQHTGGDWRESPAMAHADDVAWSTRREAYARFVRRLTSAAARDLRAWIEIPARSGYR